ncbi:MAG: glycine betaine ABC transporter substrate-binding protein [Staphylococcus epidermidis]|nr:glycine betaine ABC transporter substrate-binding protein [Staphylococcus epidermidis]
MKKYFNYTLILVALSLIVLSGCSLPGLGDGNAKDDVKITTTETSETKIIGHMEKLLIEHETDGKIKPTLFMVTKETAKKYHLEKVSDLEKYKDELRLGMDTQWMNRAGDGYPAFVKDYGFKFDSARPMQIGLVYDALKNNKLDVAVGYSTDGRIAAYDLKILEDDRKFFPPYDGSPLANEQLIKDNPEIDKALKKLEGKISTEEMQKLNYEADGKGKEPAVIAEEYLKKHHYFEEKKGGHK